MGPRFEHYLTTDPYNSAVDEECAGSRLVCCTTIQDPSYTVPERTENEDSFDDGKVTCLNISREKGYNV